MKNADPVMGAKLKSKTHLLNRFFDFLSCFLRVWLESFLKSANMTQKIFVVEKIVKDIKNAEFNADFESVEKVLKKCI
jgi:hypothetical protein